MEGVADRIYPAFGELKRQAAQGEIVHNNDTVMKVLSLMKENEEKKKKAKGKSKKKRKEERTGIFTSGMVSIRECRKMAVFLTGRKHTGENQADLLKKLKSESWPPIQMCDVLSWKPPGAFKTIVANCLAYDRRQFVDVAENFPEESIHVLQTLEAVYKNDAITKERDMSAGKRLAFHKK